MDNDDNTTIASDVSILPCLYKFFSAVIRTRLKVLESLERNTLHVQFHAETNTAHV